jgi:hypothetical protein
MKRQARARGPQFQGQPAPAAIAAKDPDEWVSGEEPMTGAQASYLMALSEQVGAPDAYTDDLTKAEASRRIDALQAKRDGTGWRRA